MKTRTRLGSIIAVLFLVICRQMTAQVFLPPDPTPRARLERIELEPGRPFDCLVLTAHPGVSYVLERSEDLIHWERDGSPHFGLGQEIVIPLVERPVASSGPPPPPSAGWTPTRYVSLIVRPGTSGGVVVSFHSPDSGGAVARHFPDLAMSPEWQQQPLFVSERHAGHAFSLLSPGTPQQPPAAAAPLSASDQLMLDVFEELFPAMDLEVQASVTRTRCLPPPPPAAPGNRQFARILGDTSGDADGDGTPDWLELAVAAAGGPDAAAGDPFNADTNGNGVRDGDEFDHDDDGAVNANDSSPGNGDVSWEKDVHFLFGAFPVTGAGAPVQVNDQGRVLYSSSIWKSGAPVALDASSGELLSDCQAVGIGDNGFILGVGDIDLPGDAGVSKSPCLVTWPVNGGAPMPLKADNAYLFPVAYPVSHSPGPAVTMPPSDMNVSGQGKFVAHLATPGSVPGPGGGQYTVLQVAPGAPRAIFQGTPGTAAVTQVGATGGDTVWIGPSDVKCGIDDIGRLKVGNHTFSGPFTRVATLPDGNLAALTGYSTPNPGGILQPQVRKGAGGSWAASDTLPLSVDVSQQGRFVLQHPWRIWMNAEDNRPAGEMAPGLPAAWRTGNPLFVDTTPKGWTLATKSASADALICLPLRLSTDAPASGLDHQSAAASDSSFYPATLRAGNKDEFWIMVPAGGSTTVRVKSAATPETPLQIGQGPDLTTQPATLNGPDQTLTLSAPATAAGKELVLPLRIGAVSSVSKPIRVKVMKPRVVKVTVWPLERPGFTETSPPSNPPPLPAEAEIASYLNGVYQPQINVTFQITVKPKSVMAADPGEHFDLVSTPLTTLNTITAGKSEGNIQVYLVGGYPSFGGSSVGPGEVVPAWTPEDRNIVWMTAGDLVGGSAQGKNRWLHTLSHEVGHVFWGSGHPNQSTKPGRAALPGTDVRLRLMQTFTDYNGTGPAPKLIVKEEWDAAEIWLVGEVDGQ